MWKYRFTVFTPTYNRSKTLPRLFESLEKQTFKDFEWLIIDDGSSDQTLQVVNAFKQKAGFPIRYFFQENTHKFLTLIKAVHLADGEFFYTVDSDDEIDSKAMEILHNTWLNIPETQRLNFSGVTGLCEDQYGSLIGSCFPTDPFDSDSLETYVRYRIKGEKSGFQKTELLRDFNFRSEYGSNGYIPEGILWVGLANRGFKTRYINKVIRKYYVDEGPSIMTTASFTSNAFGTFQFTQLFLNSYKPYFWKNIPLVVGQVRKYTASGWYLNHTTYELFVRLNSFIIRLLLILTLPISWFYIKNVKKH